MHLGDRVRQYREARGYSLSDLAREADVSRSYLYQVERGESSPTHEKILAIAQALGVAVRDLLGETGPEPEVPASLREYAQRRNLPPEDVRMLAAIQYRGNRPETPEQWHSLYRVIRSLLEDDEDPPG